MEIYHHRPAWETDLTKWHENEKYQEIQKGIKANEVDERSSQMAFHGIRMDWKQAEIP